MDKRLKALKRHENTRHTYQFRGPLYSFTQTLRTAEYTLKEFCLDREGNLVVFARGIASTKTADEINRLIQYYGFYEFYLHIQGRVYYWKNGVVLSIPQFLIGEELVSVKPLDAPNPGLFYLDYTYTRAMHLTKNRRKTD
jgi:hypothetical protein